jgi:5-methylcytosine-specific restriction endonuclease McrA
MIISCEHCGKDVYISPSRLGRTHFCSMDCFNKEKAKRFVGNKLRVGLIPTNAFPKGSKPLNGFKKGHSSSQYPKWIEAMEKQVPWNKGKTGVQEPYERTEYHKSVHAGERNHMWKGGLSKIGQRLRSTPEYKRWRTAVLERDSHTCVFCGNSYIKMEVDHIQPFWYFPDLRLSVSNGRTVCKFCHRNTDTYAGRAKSYK